MQNTTRIVGEEGIPSQKLPSLHSEPLLHQLSFLSSQNWNENINICPEPQCFQQQEFNQFCGIVSSNFLQQNQQIYDEQNIGNHNNSILLDLHTNSLSDHYSSYNNMIDENDHYLTQQLNIQSSQQNELLLITTPTSSTTSKTTTQFPLYPPTSLNNQNFLLQQLQQSQTSIFMPSPSSPSLPLIKQFSSLECTEQTKNNFPQFLSNNISSFSSSGTNLTVSSNRKSNLVNTKKSSLTSRRLNGGIQSSRRRRRERFNNNNNLICETTQLINENNEKEKALLYQQIGILKANMIEDITKSEKVSNPPQLLNSLSPINEQKGIKEKNNIITPPICAHCNEQIQEKEMLSLRKKEKIIKIKSTKIDENKLKEENIQQFYHLKCLNCSECNEDLKSETKCFEKDNNIYCSDCYAKTMMDFNSRNVFHCATCEKQLLTNDWFRRARQWIYHLTCFKCEHCGRQLNTNEQFALDKTVQRKSEIHGLVPRLLCKQHYLELVLGEQCSPKPKAKRIRTTFGEEQLSILQENFKVDSNPDGADLERIARETGLTKRVTQVWFQNSRARQKKYVTGSSNGDGNTSTNIKTCGSSSNSNCSANGFGSNGIVGSFCRSITTTPISSSPNGANSPFEAVIFGEEENDNNERMEEETTQKSNEMTF